MCARVRTRDGRVGSGPRAATAGRHSDPRTGEGARDREERCAPVAQEREGQILAQKGRKPKAERRVPTLVEFKPRFIEGHVKANRLKPSSAEAYESIFRTHLVPEFGAMRLDRLGDELVQRFKGELVEDGMANKSINNVLTALSVMLKRAVDWKVIDAMPCRIRLLKWDKGDYTFCSHLAMQGATAKAIQELAGHQSLTTTQRYMHLSPAHKDAAIRLLDRRPVDDGDDVRGDDNISPIKMAAASAPPAPSGAATVGDGLETGLRPEPESSRSE